MRAVICARLGPPETLKVMEVADPAPEPGEVLVDVRAAALNFFDTLIIEGRYQVRAEPPFSPGGEFVGTVAALGAGVDGPAPGTRVIGHSGWGACAEKIVVPASRLVAIPNEIADEAAAGLLITYGTALHALKDRGGLAPGETLAVLGASGGAGLAAVEIGRLLGARVIACASDDTKLAVAADHGAETLINYGRDDLKTALKAAARDGVDVVFDPVGGQLTEAAVRALGWRGRLLVVGFAGGGIPKLPLNLTLVKGCDVRGVFWGRFMDEEPDAFAADTRQLVDWCAEGRLRPHVDSKWPLEGTADGLRRLSGRQARGKVIVTP